MPQIDKVSFFSQVFWSVGLFILFYVFIVKNLFPKLASIMKFRAETLNWNKTNSGLLNDEKELLKNTAVSELNNSLDQAREVFNTSNNSGKEWLKNFSADKNKNELNKVNTELLNNLTEVYNKKAV